jgi:hypothetical protein
LSDDSIGDLTEECCCWWWMTDNYDQKTNVVSNCVSTGVLVWCFVVSIGVSIGCDGQRCCCCLTMDEDGMLLLLLDDEQRQ